LTSALAGGEWSGSCLGLLAPDTHWIVWVDTRAALDKVEKRKYLTLPGLEFRYKQIKFGILINCYQINKLPIKILFKDWHGHYTDLYILQLFYPLESRQQNFVLANYSGTSAYVHNPFQILGLITNRTYTKQIFPIRNKGKMINPFP
jgi:hypothetical protein